MPEVDVFEARFATAYRRYLDEAPTRVDAAEVVRAVVATAPRTRLGVAPWMLRPARALVWLVLLGLLFAALLGISLFVASQRPMLRDVALSPTGIDVLTAETAEYGRLVVDGEGVLWAREAGNRLVRLDPATGAGRSWTISDDAAFAMSEIAPAHAGGVWLVTGRRLRWFDGTAFREVIEAPAGITVLTEAPDATLWAGTNDGVVLHWNGSSWERLDPGRPSSTAWLNAIAADMAGRVWVGWLQGAPAAQPGWVSRYDGTRWTRLDGGDAPPLGGGIWSITELRDGSVWVASEAGLARFDGTSWTDETPKEAVGLALSSVSAAADGAIWTTSGSTDSASISVGRFDGHAWAWYGTSEGLPLDAGCYTAWGAPTEHGAFVGTCDGIFRLSNGRWERAWPPVSSGPAWLGVLLPVSRDELWAAWRGDSGLWHLQDGDWTYEEITANPTAAPTVLTRAPDGTLWAGGADGVAYRRDGRWIVADTTAASAIAVDAGGTVWVAGTDTWRTPRLNAGPELWTLHFDGTAWVKRVIEGCPLESLGLPIGSLAFDEAGRLWVGIRGGFERGGLARFEGRSWETIGQVGGRQIDGATILGTASDGSLWVAVQQEYLRPDGAHSYTFSAARFDGTGWTVVEMPDGDWVIPVLGPNGTVWASTTGGPARYDGPRWTYPYEVAFPWTGGMTVAPDGAVFVSLGSSLLRFPATR